MKLGIGLPNTLVVLILFPQIASLEQVERLAEDVLPAYAEPERRAA